MEGVDRRSSGSKSPSKVRSFPGEDGRRRSGASLGGRIPSLKVCDGRDAGEVFEIEGRSVVVGRSSRSDIRLTDGKVSRRHARIHVEKSALNRRKRLYRIVDLESKNGVFINGVPQAEAYLQDGDRILLGKSLLKFRLREGGRDSGKVSEK